MLPVIVAPWNMNTCFPFVITMTKFVLFINLLIFNIFNFFQRILK